MRAIYSKVLRFSAAVAILWSVCIPSPLSAQGDLSAELDKALQQAGQAGEVFDAAGLLRLQALVRQATTPEQLRLVETRLVQTIESDAPLSAKQAVCRILWQIGSARSAPALQRLLARPETVDIACYAIANNPVPELGQAARETLSGSTGKVAVSLLNLLGQRRDTNAVGLIAPWLQHEQSNVSDAAATALGKIGGRRAVVALDRFRKTVPQDRRVMADEAYLCAMETLDATSAVPLWKDLIALQDESSLVRRGALVRLSDQAPEAALAWLLAALREEERALKPAAGQALRSLRDQTVIAQVADNLPTLPASSQTIVLDALGPSLPMDRLVALIHQPAVRLSAMRVLGARGGPQAAMALLKEALSPNTMDDRPEIFRLLKTLPGQETTDVLMKSLPTAPAPFLSDLVQVLAARDAKIPVPILIERARHGDRSARLHAIRALRLAASPSDHAALFGLLTSADDPETHEAIEETIAGIFRRSGDGPQQAGWILEQLESAQRPRDRQAWLRLLAATGTPAALQRVLGQVRQGSAEDRDVAFRSLTQWPNDAALEPLIVFAGEPFSGAQRGLALRGAVRLLRDSQLPPATKTDRFRRLMPLASDPASRKLLLSGLAGVHDPGAMTLIVPCLDDPDVRAEAALAAIALAPNLGPGDDAVVNAAMNQVWAVVEDAGLRSQAKALLRTPRPPLPDVYLDTLIPLKAVSGNDGGKGRPQINRNCTGQPLKLKGVTYERGVGEHAPAELTYELKPAYTRFVCIVGLDDQVARYNDVRGSIVVNAFADTHLLAQTPVLRGGGASAHVDVAIPSGAKALRLVVEDAGDGVGYDDADFVYAGFIGSKRSPAASIPSPATMDNEGFIPLFDNHSFAGWEGNPQVFRIEDGAIVGGSLKAPVPRNEFLCTTNEYSDFELRLKFKLLGTNANAGVQIRSRRVPGNEVSGYQADLGQTYWGNLYDESRRNTTLVQCNQDDLRRVLRLDDWNDYRIRCQGRRIQLSINGHPTADYTEPQAAIAQTGIIGLQIHGGPPSEAWYKDIAIRRLP